MRVVVLGGGRVGSAMALDLAADDEFDVTVADLSAERLARLEGRDGIATAQADLSSADEVRRVVAEAELVVGAVPGSMGLATLRTVIEAGRDVVDISFFPEDPYLVDQAARSAGVRVLVDCGIAPGCSNLILGRLTREWDRVDRFACYVGGLPLERRWPWEYKAPFSPADVIEEYTRPARFVRNGVQVEMPALTEVELIDFPGVGTLEAFNSDGLRTILKTVQAPWMVEKTMRYPGHAEKMRMLRETGLFGTKPVDVNGAQVVPRELTSRLLFPAWELAEGEEDLTAMRVVADGVAAGRAVRRTYDLLDRYDHVTGTTSMARTTGYTCTAMTRAVARGLWTEPGVWPPELLGRDAAFYEFVMAELSQRGVIFNASEKALG